jgi:exosortase
MTNESTLPSTAGEASLRGAWLKGGFVAALTMALYADVVPGMVSIWWNDPGYSHGLLIPPLALYIAWMQRPEILATPARGDVRGLWLTGLACLLYTVGRLGAEFFLTRISLVVLIAGLVWTFWGFPRLRKLGFPFFLLLTMVPLPAILYNRLAAPLQLFASTVSTGSLQAAGIPVFRDGNIIHLAQNTLGIAEACSGLRSLLSLAVLALVMGYVWFSHVSLRAVLLALSIPIAIGVNVLRIVGTALVSERSPALAEGFYHTFSGWLVFLAGFGLLFLTAKGLALIETASPRQPTWEASP